MKYEMDDLQNDLDDILRQLQDNNLNEIDI